MREAFNGVVGTYVVDGREYSDIWEQNRNQYKANKTLLQKFRGNSGEEFTLNLCIFFGLIVFACLIIGAIYTLIPRTMEVCVMQTRWEREIIIGQQVSVIESSWTLPDDTIPVRVNMEIYGYKTPFFGEWGEPIYKPRYYYEVFYEQITQTVRSGGFVQNPYWADYTLEEGEQVLTERGLYYVTAYDKDGKFYTMTMDEDEWLKVEQGDIIRITTQGLRDDLAVDEGGNQINGLQLQR